MTKRVNQIELNNTFSQEHFAQNHRPRSNYFYAWALGIFNLKTFLQSKVNSFFCFFVSSTYWLLMLGHHLVDKAFNLETHLESHSKR